MSKYEWKRYMIRLFSKRCAIFFIFLLMLMPHAVNAEIKYFDLTNPFLRKIPMAVPAFQSMSKHPTELNQVGPFSKELMEMLEFSGYFKMLDRGSFLHDPQKSGITRTTINFQNWTMVGAELLITGGLRMEGGQLVSELRLFDTFKSKLLIGKRYRGKVEDRREVVKRFCAEVLLVLTGHAGFFDSQLAFVSNGTGNKEIFKCDFDGKNVRQVTKKRSITSFPAWSSNGRHLAFTSYDRGPVQIIIKDLKTMAESRVRYKGVQISPAWVPNRFELTATLSRGGDQEIYLLTGKGKMIKRLTNSRGIDVDATWSPDGKKIAFVSKRSGRPQIYIKEINTGRVQRLTFEGNYNTQPCWSPKGNMIAYSSMAQGEINIFVMDIERNDPIQLTFNQRDNEAPSWSPDGSLIAFSTTREGNSRIYVMTAYGTDQRRLLKMPGGQFHPRWSPNIPH
jgi:TolB protein